MASFVAELHVDGRMFAIIKFTYGTYQSTGARGRVNAKVRYKPTILVLVVPEGDFLLEWAANPTRRYACDLVVRGLDGSAQETLHYAGAYCVGYKEDFGPNADGHIAYLLTLTLTDPGGWTLTPGGPANPAFVRPQPLAAAPVTAPAPPVEPPPVEPPVELVIPRPGWWVKFGFLTDFLLSSFPTGDVGFPVQSPVTEQDKRELARLEAMQEAGAQMTHEEQNYLLYLLAKVKGIRAKSIDDLNVEGLYKGQPVELPGFNYEEIFYTKRDPAATAALRSRFKTVRAAYMKKISTEPQYVIQLKAAGFDDADIELMQTGLVPADWQVHHQLPLDDGGDNSFNNLILIKQTPYHSCLTYYQRINTGKLKSGEIQQVKWPVYRRGIVYPPKP